MEDHEAEFGAADPIISFDYVLPEVKAKSLKLCILTSEGGPGDRH
jgi:hypothetical protein